MPKLLLDDLRKVANNRKIPNADTLDFEQLLKALANQSQHISSQISSQTNNSIENQVNR